jgi:hypothetical protein
MDKIWTGQAPSLYAGWDQGQRKVLLAGLVLDGLFGLLFFMTRFSTLATAAVQRLGLLPQMPDIWFELSGIFLLVMALIYWMSSRDVNRYLGNVVVAIIGKAVSVPFYLFWVTCLGAPKMFALIAFCDTVVGACHVYMIGPGRVVRMRGAFRKATTIQS